jgi:cold shock CspA family protein
MRFNGTVGKWNDDRGFGFITPTRGGEPVFVHISAFPRDGGRPRVGEVLTFEVEPAGDGKKRAIKVVRPSPPAPSRPRAPVRVPLDRRPRPAGSRWSFRYGAIAVMLVVLGASAFYEQFGRAKSGVTTQVDPTRPPATQERFSTTSRCDGRTHCSQMTSCEEAKFFLNNCPGTQMDGDGNGVPCERQWCTGSFRR